MTTYTENDMQVIVGIANTERDAVEFKAFALALFMFVGGAAIGFLIAYGICRWGW